MISSAVLAVTERGWTRKLITETALGRRVAERFVAGETLESAVAVARTLNEEGLKVSMDHLGEHVTDVDDAVAAKDAYLACAHAIHDAVTSIDA